MDTFVPWLSADEKVKEMFAKQGEKDLESFLVNRSKELVKGQLVQILSLIQRVSVFITLLPTVNKTYHIG